MTLKLCATAPLRENNKMDIGSTVIENGAKFLLGLTSGRWEAVPTSHTHQDQRVEAATLWNPPLGTYGFQSSLNHPGF